MNFENQSPKAIISKIEKLNEKFSGHEKFLAMSMIIAKGEKISLIRLDELKKVWGRASCGVYRPIFYERAETADWVFPDPDSRKNFYLTDNGILHFNKLAKIQDINLKEIRKAGDLIIVNKKATFSFDVFLRETIKKAKTKILIADSYVDETLIDNYLNIIPNTIITKVLYGKDCGSFIVRASRYKTQYSKFDFLEYLDLHDRFMIVDNVGYVLGPSIKDGATNSPALVVALSSQESLLLTDFFMELWNMSKMSKR